MSYTAKPGASNTLKAVHRCAHPDCNRWTVQTLCDRHRAPKPTGEWAIAAQLRDELAALDDEDQ